MQNNQFTKILAVSITFMAFQAISGQAAAAQPPALAEKGHGQQHAVISEDNLKWRRDPFGGGNTKNAKTPAGRIQTGVKSGGVIMHPEITLQGIMQTGNAFHALINGRVVKAGDKLDGLTVKEISRYRVTVQSENKEKSIYDIYQGRIDRGKHEK